MIVVKNLFVQMRKKNILHDISIQINNGKVTSILGPNGSGKSTLLQCLTGSQSINGGTIKLNDKSLYDYSLIDLSVKRAVLSQSNAITFPFTSLEIVMMGRNPYSGSNKEDYIISLEALKQLDAAHLKDRIFTTLSGGEQQRVQIARVLAQLWNKKDSYLFLDEPTSALDLKHQHQLLQLVSKLARESNFAICIIIHDINLAMRYSDHAILLKNGKLFAQGSISNVLNENAIEEVFEVPQELIYYSDKSNQVRF